MDKEINLNHVFCFVSSANTEEFSALALESFFNKTKLEKGDIFVFVNNDGTNSFRKQFPIDVYINNKTPKRWAENFNKGLRIAKKFKKHFVVITNDIVCDNCLFNFLIIYSIQDKHNSLDGIYIVRNDG